MIFNKPLKIFSLFHKSIKDVLLSYLKYLSSEKYSSIRKNVNILKKKQTEKLKECNLTLSKILFILLFVIYFWMIFQFLSVIIVKKKHVLEH